MSVMDWMKSKATETNSIFIDDNGNRFEKYDLSFYGRLPYHMMKEVKKGYFEQKVTGDIKTGNYIEEGETMHIYGDKNPIAVYNFSRFTQVKGGTK